MEIQASAGEDTPIKSGVGEKQSTNYQPTLKISGWVARGDLVFQPKVSSAPSTAPADTAPATGSTRVSAPSAAPEMADSDFG